MIKTIFTAAAIAVVATGASAQFVNFDENGFIAEAEVVQTEVCTRDDGVSIETWEATAGGDYEGAVFRRLLLGDEELAREDERSDGHVITISDRARIEIHDAEPGSMFAPGTIRDSLLKRRGLDKWDLDLAPEDPNWIACVDPRKIP